jgi:hypothetical protein
VGRRAGQAARRRRRGDRSLAQAAGAGSKTWRAYLSTQGSGGVNAKARIGNGPWFNAKGMQIAANVADLHGDNNKINKETALDEKGMTVKGRGDTPNQHDMLTGTQRDGTAVPGTDDEAMCPAADRRCARSLRSQGGALSDSYKCIFSRVSRSKFRSVVAWS